MKGHAHITDFNIAAKVDESKTAAGSLAYMAPEVLNEKVCRPSIDWWSLGVIIFEMATCQRPFKGSTNEELQNSILTSKIEYPLFKISPELEFAVQKFLKRDPITRLGSIETGGFTNLKKQPFFSTIEWALLELKLVDPPFTPSSKKVNFDATHELSELLLEEKPLKHVTGNRKTRSDSSNDIFENSFPVFDFTFVNK